MRYLHEELRTAVAEHKANGATDEDINAMITAALQRLRALRATVPHPPLPPCAPRD